MIEQFVYVVLFIVMIVVVSKYMSKKPASPQLPANYPDLLQQHVSYYRLLAPIEKKYFEAKMNYFLQHTRIEGVGTSVDDLDRVLVAASAVIPIFAFPDWHYYNLTDVLLYKDTFNEEFHIEGTGRNTLGMVGEGAMQNTMILSKPSLYAGFDIRADKNQTGIHEFVHLLDKSDGATDGLPENLIGKEYALPWLKLMHKTMAQMRHGKTDINIYGATNEAEFLAVTAEYFCKNPEELKEKHPELFELLQQIFHQDPAHPSGN